MNVDVAIIGGGPAGLGAALEAKKMTSSVLVIERDRELGGILNQCIHNGFGLHEFKEELTGPEYAGRFIQQAKEANIDFMLNTMVLHVDEKKHIVAVNEEGVHHIRAKAVVFAMGCRERTRGSHCHERLSPGGSYDGGHGATYDEYGRSSGRQGSGDLRQWRHWIDYGTSDDFGRRKSESGGGDYAFFQRIKSKYRSVFGGL